VYSQRVSSSNCARRHSLASSVTTRTPYVKYHVTFSSSCRLCRTARCPAMTYREWISKCGRSAAKVCTRPRVNAVPVRHEVAATSKLHFDSNAVAGITLRPRCAICCHCIRRQSQAARLNLTNMMEFYENLLQHGAPVDIVNAAHHRAHYGKT